jgi:hypothetical protein
MSQAIEWLERFVLTVLQDHARPRHPIGAVSVNQMADDIHDRECSLAFIVIRPELGQAAQQCIQRTGSMLKQLNRAIQIVAHVTTVSIAKAGSG